MESQPTKPECVFRLSTGDIHSGDELHGCDSEPLNALNTTRSKPPAGAPPSQAVLGVRVVWGIRRLGGVLCHRPSGLCSVWNRFRGMYLDYSVADRRRGSRLQRGRGPVMDAVSPRLGLQPALVGWGRFLVVLVFAFAAVDWVGWATGILRLTRVYPGWPPMTPWTALWLAALGSAIVVQSGSAAPTRVWAGRGVAAVVGVLTVVVLAEYASARSFGVDQVWFGQAVRKLQSTWPGRPSPQTAMAVLFLSVAVGL